MAKASGDDLPDPDLKIILLGDSAVGKSKLIERFLMDEYNPRQVGNYYSKLCSSYQMYICSALNVCAYSLSKRSKNQRG